MCANSGSGGKEGPMKEGKGAGIANTYLDISQFDLFEPTARIFTCIIYISRGLNEHTVRPARAGPGPSL